MDSYLGSTNSRKLFGWKKTKHKQHRHHTEKYGSVSSFSSYRSQSSLYGVVPVRSYPWDIDVQEPIYEDVMLVSGSNSCTCESPIYQELYEPRRKKNSVTDMTEKKSYKKFIKSLENRDPFSSVSSRKSILECDINAYDLVKKLIKGTDSDLDDNLSDNAVEEDRGIYSSIRLAGYGVRLGTSSEGTSSTQCSIASDDGIYSLPEPDYEDSDEDIPRFKDLKIASSPLFVRKRVPEKPAQPVKKVIPPCDNNNPNVVASIKIHSNYNKTNVVKEKFLPKKTSMTVAVRIRNASLESSEVKSILKKTDNSEQEIYVNRLQLPIVQEYKDTRKKKHVHFKSSSRESLTFNGEESENTSVTGSIDEEKRTTPSCQDNIGEFRSRRTNCGENSHLKAHNVNRQSVNNNDDLQTENELPVRSVLEPCIRTNASEMKSIVHCNPDVSQRESDCVRSRNCVNNTTKEKQNNLTNWTQVDKMMMRGDDFQSGFHIRTNQEGKERSVVCIQSEGKWTHSKNGNSSPSIIIDVRGIPNSHVNESQNTPNKEENCVQIIENPKVQENIQQEEEKIISEKSLYEIPTPCNKIESKDSQSEQCSNIIKIKNDVSRINVLTETNCKARIETSEPVTEIYIHHNNDMSKNSENKDCPIFKYINSEEKVPSENILSEESNVSENILAQNPNSESLCANLSSSDNSTGTMTEKNTLKDDVLQEQLSENRPQLVNDTVNEITANNTIKGTGLHFPESLQQQKSFFEGASKTEILSYLEQAKSRGVDDLTEEDIRSLVDSESPLIIIDKPPSTIDKFSEDILQNAINVPKLQLLDVKDDIEHLSAADIERNDSGVGTETSKPSRLRRVILPGTEEISCADCDLQIASSIDNQQSSQFFPLVCEKCDKKRSERKEIIAEIVDTEFKYGRDLKVIKEEFNCPMEVAGLLTKVQLRSVFLNLDELIRVNVKFSEKLKDAIDIAVEQGDEDYTNVNIGRLFLESSSMLHAFEAYCVRQGNSSMILTNLEKEKELLRIFLRVSQMENTLLRRMNLPAFLMVPVQRVTKYPLLLSRLYKVTPYHHQDREALKEAQHKIEIHLEHINQQTKGSGCTKIWRRFSNISVAAHRRITNGVDIGNIRLRKLALEVLRWNRDEVRFVMAGKLLYTQVSDYPWMKKSRKTKYAVVHALLAVLGKPNSNYRPDLASENMVLFPKDTGIRDATLLLMKEKNGRYVPIHEPLHLGSCVITNGIQNEHFEIQEYSTKESFHFKAETNTDTREWLKQLRYHAKDLGTWRRRRNALANIMINGLGGRT